MMITMMMMMNMMMIMTMILIMMIMMIMVMVLMTEVKNNGPSGKTTPKGQVKNCVKGPSEKLRQRAE